MKRRFMLLCIFCTKELICLSIVYIDVMRMVSPGDPLKDSEFDFYLLGGFDAMKVQTNVEAIHQLSERHKQRHIEIPKHFERQPLYAYSPDPIKPKLFSREDDAEDMPLVLTLFQLDDFILNKSPEELIHTFSGVIEGLITQAQETIVHQVFWNLGESDLVAVFRAPRLEPVGKLLVRMRSWCNEREHLRVLSTCSHCAFPAPADGVFQAHFQKWLECDRGVSIFTLANTSYGMNDIQAVPGLDRFLFGEWDYCRNWPDNPRENALLYGQHVTKILSEFDPRHPMPFRAAYTVPMVQLNRSDMDIAAASRQTLSDLNLLDSLSEQIEPGEDKPNSCFRFLACAVDALSPLYGNGSKEIAKSIQSLGSTMTGLAKHLYRLLAGRFEQDLYAYVQPIFLYVQEITRSHGTALNAMRQRWQDALSAPLDRKKQEYAQGLSEQISLLLSGYVQSTSELLSHLQHLFSILSVSPHTFLETYGSNMRSLAAACKILIAYQGICYCLDRDYGDLLLDQDGGNVRSQHAVLVLPYRNISTNNRLLFSLSDPAQRISAIQIDFTKMFHVSETIFMLLHECAHQLVGANLRAVRAKHYIQAVMLELVSEAFGGYMMDGTSVPNWLEDSELDQATFRVNPDVRKDVDQTVRNCHQMIASSLAKNALISYADYCSQKEGMICDALLRNKMSKYVTDHLKKWLRDSFSKTITEDSIPWDGLLILYVYPIFYCHWSIAVNALKTMEADDPLRSLALWKTQFFSVPPMQSGKIPPIDGAAKKRLISCIEKGRQVILRRYQNVCDELSQVFGDIFCDVFAAKILSVAEEKPLERAKEYLMWFYNPQDPSQNLQLQRNLNLARAYAVLDCCYGIDNQAQVLGLLAEIRLNEEELKQYRSDPAAFIAQSPFWQELSQRLDGVRDALYFSEVQTYAKTCAKEIEDRLRQSSALQEIQTHLRMMRSQDTEWIIEGICYFWRQSTTRPHQEQEESV